MTTVRSISRKITMSADEATKTKLDPAELQRQGWTLFDGTWSRLIQVPQFVEKENTMTAGGVPDIGKPSVDDVLNGVDELMKDPTIPAELLVKAINNGLYLHFNAKGKPKAKTSVTELTALFFASKPSAEEMAAYAQAAIGHKADEFVKAWYAKKPTA